MNDFDYREDKKYILETLKTTVDYLGKMDDKFNQFKLEMSTGMVIIQTKLRTTSFIGSAVFGFIFSIISGVIVYTLTKGS